MGVARKAATRSRSPSKTALSWRNWALVEIQALREGALDNTLVAHEVKTTIYALGRLRLYQLQRHGRKAGRFARGAHARYASDNLDWRTSR